MKQYTDKIDFRDDLCELDGLDAVDSEAWPEDEPETCQRCGKPVSGPQFAHCRKCQPIVTREKLLERGKLCTCLLCGAEIFSEHLADAIPDQLAYLVAVHVTHYRHEHVRYYNNSVKFVAGNRDYDDFKHVVNERAKRQLIRKACLKLRALGVNSGHFAMLQGTEEKTLLLARDLLDGEPAGAKARRRTPDNKMVMAGQK